MLRGKVQQHTKRGPLNLFIWFCPSSFFAKKGQKKAPSVKNKDITCLLYKKKLSSYIFQLAQRSILSQHRIYTFRECRTSPCNFCHPWVFTTRLSLCVTEYRFVNTNEGWKIAILIKKKIIFFNFQAFIVRQSSQTNTLALTVSIEEIIEHYLIQPSKQCGDKLSLESSEHSFDNVLSLVHHYSTTKYVKIQSVLPTLKIWWPKT